MTKPQVAIDRRADGSILLWDRQDPGRRPRSIAHLLDDKAALHPERPWIKQRTADFGPWRTITYGEAARMSAVAAAKLRALGLGPDAPLMILSGNSIEHAVLTLAAMKIRAPVVPISTAYATVSKDYSKLKHCFGLIEPRAIFVQTHAAFAAALQALPLAGVTILSADPHPPKGVIALSSLVGGEGEDGVADEMARIDDSTVAKLLFTSGSTGSPKACPQTQGMLCAQIAAQDGIRAEDPDPDHVPQWLEWMPWSHVSAGNVGFNAVLWSGATLHLDDGKPLPGLFDLTIRNLREVSPDVFGTAPIAYARLAEAMEGDLALRRSFFKNLRYMGYGGAALSDDLYDRLQALAIAETGQRISFSGMYGATETQGVTVVNWEVDRVGLIGLPLPSIVLKLVPWGDRYEARVKGPTVASGYYKDPVRTSAAFDEQGFYRLGDAVRFVDDDDPSKGLLFDGRVTEDFKLDSGTWVSVGALRADLIAACSPWVSDIVIAGQDKAFVAALIWPSAAAVEAASAGGGDGLQRLRDMIGERLAAFNATQGGSSRRIARARILAEPPSIDAGEITDKGYVNQRAVLDVRQREVQALYAAVLAEDTILI